MTILDSPDLASKADAIPDAPDFGELGRAMAEQMERLSGHSFDPPAPDERIAEPDGTIVEGSDTATDPPSPPSGVSADATAQADAPTGAVADGAPPAGDGAVSTFAVSLQDGTTVELTEAQVRSMAELSGWANSLPVEMREQFAAIEANQAVAVSRADYERLMALQQAGTTPGGTDYDDLDPDVAARVRELEAENARFRAEANQPDPQTLATQQVELVRRANEMHSRVLEWAGERNLTEADAQVLLDSAVRANVIPNIVESHRTYNPVTGALMADADIRTVADQAMSFALTMNPNLYERAMTPTPTPSRAADAVSVKKRNSASLAAAPSASVPQPPSDPRSMTPQQRQEAMAAAIAAAQGAG
jgi:hypothetical protein